MNTIVTIRMKGEVSVRLSGDGPSSDFHWQLEEFAKKNGLVVDEIDMAMRP